MDQKELHTKQLTGTIVGFVLLTVLLFGVGYCIRQGDQEANRIRAQKVVACQAIQDEALKTLCLAGVGAR